jgi:hypothetical protein
MGIEADRLTGLAQSKERFDIPYSDVIDTQVKAVNERLQERKDHIRLLAHRLRDAHLTEVRSRDDIVRLLFPHTAYKSYSESTLLGQKWDRLGKWLDAVSTYRVPQLDTSKIQDIDDWVGQLERSGHHLSCTSGTTGKAAMLVASSKDLEWVKRDTVNAFAWGSGVQPAQDRRVFGLAGVAALPRGRAAREAQIAAFGDPQKPAFGYPISPITIGKITKMIVLRKSIADGTAMPAELAAYEEESAARQKEIDDAVGITADALVEARHDKLFLGGLWAGIYNVAKAVRDRGYSAKDFHPENTIYVGGGLKRAVLPADYREFVYGTFNISPEQNFQNYSMQELHTGMPRCREGGRYHVPPWLVPLVLDKDGDVLHQDTKGEIEGRAAFFDLSLDGRWGGVISGDKISLSFERCACGNRSPSIRDNVVRYADLEGDDKITCAGTIDAYVRGLS